MLEFPFRRQEKKQVLQSKLGPSKNKKRSRLCKCQGGTPCKRRTQWQKLDVDGLSFMSHPLLRLTLGLGLLIKILMRCSCEKPMSRALGIILHFSPGILLGLLSQPCPSLLSHLETKEGPTPRALGVGGLGADKDPWTQSRECGAGEVSTPEMFRRGRCRRKEEGRP